MSRTFCAKRSYPSASAITWVLDALRQRHSAWSSSSTSMSFRSHVRSAAIVIAHPRHTVTRCRRNDFVASREQKKIARDG
jgi:hypothetical protein